MLKKIAVLNPKAMGEGNAVHLLRSAVTSCKQSTTGYFLVDAALKTYQRFKTSLRVQGFEDESQYSEDTPIFKNKETYYYSYAHRFTEPYFAPAKNNVNDERKSRFVHRHK